MLLLYLSCNYFKDRFCYVGIYKRNILFTDYIILRFRIFIFFFFSTWDKLIPCSHIVVEIFQSIIIKKCLNCILMEHIKKGYAIKFLEYRIKNVK